MNLNAPRTVIFGAGGLGQSFILKNSVKPDEVVFCDNAPSLWGTQVLGITVLKPDVELLRLCQRVIVTSSFAGEILHQLKAYGVDSQKIFFASKRIVTLMDTQVLNNSYFRSTVLELLGMCFDAVIRDGLEAFVDYGTLLGLWRDGDLIAGDGDLDVTVINRSQSQQEMLHFMDIFYGAANICGMHSTPTATSETAIAVDFSNEDFTYSLGVGSVPMLGRDLDWQAGGYPPTLSNSSSILPLKRISWPTTALVPADPHSLLFARYGRNWRTPEADWAYLYGDLGDVQVLTEWSHDQ